MLLTVTPHGSPGCFLDIPDQSALEGVPFATIALDDYVTDDFSLDSEITWAASGNTDLTVDITDRVATITAREALDW